MERIINWILKHRVLTFLIVVGIFALPLLAIHFLFFFDAKYDWLAASWDSGDVLGYVAGFEAFFGTVFLGLAAFRQNQQIHNQHIDSLEPNLSMRLIEDQYCIYLLVENTGESPAKQIRIDVEEINNNGNENLSLDDLFKTDFELYPHEIVQGCIAMSGRNIVTHIFPKITVHVSYVRADIDRKREYTRTVVYDGGYSRKVIADVNMDNHTLESDVDCIARASVRVANYLDGHSVAKFDQLDILSGRSLQNDLVSAIVKKRKSQIVSREDTIKKRKR